MIKFELNSALPIKEIKALYEKSIKFGQLSPEAFVVSTVNNNKPSARFVNIKEIKNNNLIFYTNYKSRKAKEIKINNNIAGVFYWKSINCQIRIEGKIKKLDPKESDLHFQNRSYEKNIASISSNQSNVIKSYSHVEEKYQKNLKKYCNKDIKRPTNWGGYSIEPRVVEIWTGEENRLNHRKRYMLQNKSNWLMEILEP